MAHSQAEIHNGLVVEMATTRAYRFQHQIPYIILSHPRLAKSRSIALAAASPWAMAVGTEGWGESVMSPAA